MSGQAVATDACVYFNRMEPCCGPGAPRVRLRASLTAQRGLPSWWDSCNKRIQVFDKDGTFRRQFPIPGCNTKTPH
jgi:hypothetical protein